MVLTSYKKIVDKTKHKITFDSMQCKDIDLEADEKLGVYHWRWQSGTANWMYGSNTDDHKPKSNTTEKCKLRVCIDGCEMLISL